jgi:hypothetical protein
MNTPTINITESAPARCGAEPRGRRGLEGCGEGVFAGRFGPAAVEV